MLNHLDHAYTFEWSVRDPVWWHCKYQSCFQENPLINTKHITHKQVSKINIMFNAPCLVSQFKWMAFSSWIWSCENSPLSDYGLNIVFSVFSPTFLLCFFGFLMRFICQCFLIDLWSHRIYTEIKWHRLSVFIS